MIVEFNIFKGIGSAVTNEEGEVVGRVIGYKLEDGNPILILDIDKDGDLDVGHGIR